MPLPDPQDQFRPPSPWRDIGLVLLALLALVAGSWLLWGCSKRPAARATAPAAAGVPAAGTTDTTPGETSDVAKARRERDEAKQKLASAEARLRSAEEARDAARTDRLRLIALWVAGIALLGAFASLALWFIIPVGLKRWAVAGLGASMSVLVLAMVFNAALPYLLWAAWALAIAGLVWLVWFVIKALRAGREIAAHGDRLERAITDWVDEKVVDRSDLLGVVKTLSADAQDRAGVRHLVAAMRGKPKPAKPGQAAG